eukprot:TRINITY_DN7125_c0_g2_i7.p1 TRINITY_DN7125_c0_g2~~TRINITY_DN7125_c0_g2_i7.p1  ORF type:complete len:192 (+),score=32.15 TRINITY_DN7125_c0_g2_i7:108-683(+)
MVVSSATKYLGGHSDLVAGIIVVPDKTTCKHILELRTILGNFCGNMEGWLLLRSARTLQLRVQRQSENAVKVAEYLASQPLVKRVVHASRPDHPDHELAKRVLKGFSPVVVIDLQHASHAAAMPTCTKLFLNATSLGGVESLIDYRHRHDVHTPPTIIRLSIGVEDAADLIRDLDTAFKKLAQLPQQTSKL